MTNQVIEAADRILQKWKTGYDALIMPMFDGHHVFGEELEPSDIHALDIALAAALNRGTLWDWDDPISKEFLA